MLNPIWLTGFEPFRYVMAPMAGITDTVFRLLIRELGAQVVISELLSAEGLVRGGQRTREMLKFDERERPVGIQLFGGDETTLIQAAQIVEADGADFVDLNLGCPVKKIVCDGGGAAWLKDPVKLGRLLSNLRKAIGIPLTIKTRTGWDETSINIHEIVSIASDSGVSWVAIHGRTRAQGYSGDANWDLIRSVAEKSPIPIIGNGDLVSASAAREKIESGACHAVMIGRGALKDPWIFQELLGKAVDRDFIQLIRRHFDLAVEKKDRRRAFLSLKKFLSWYASGFPNCSQFRASVFATEEIDSLWKISQDYFESVNHLSPVTDCSNFLMGGHG